MSAPEFGPWEPLGLGDAFDIFGGVSFRWWVCGGHALELHVGRSWRSHDDTDIGILRRDVVALGSVLQGWDIHVAAAGQLTPWNGEPLRAALHQNNLWCRRRVEGPWELDVTIGDGDDHVWIYRRDPSVRIPWADAVLRTAGGIPYLAPDLQLLYKSKGHRDKNSVDASEVARALDPEHRHQLGRLLSADHPWQQLLADATGHRLEARAEPNEAGGL